MKVSSLRQAPALLAKIRLACEGLPESNTLAYRAHRRVTNKINCCENRIKF